MSFVLSKLVWLLIRPGNILLLLAVIGGALSLRSSGIWRRIGVYALGGSLAFGVAITVLPVAYWVLVPLEHRFPRPAVFPESIAGIVILGGALDPARSHARGTVIATGAADRLIETLALARRYEDVPVLLTGGSGSVVLAEAREAPVLADVLSLAGIARSRLLLEPNSRNTYENALFSARMVTIDAADPWLLVTSAAHMPRSVGIFRAMGWHVVPVATDYRAHEIIDPIADMSFAKQLALLEYGVREWVGLVAYWALGRIHSLFPGPGDDA